MGQSAPAAVLYWGPNGSGTPIGGTGAWNTSSANWSTNLAGSSYVAWNNANLDTARFPTLGETGDLAVAGTVSLGTPITAGSLYIGRTGYTIDNGGNASNTLTLTAATPTIEHSADVISTISAVLHTSGGLNRQTTANHNSGNLILSGNNTYAGVTNILTGTLTAAHNNALGVGGNSFANRTIVNTSMRLNFNGNVTVNEYVVVDGSGQLNNTSGNNTLTGTLEATGAGVAILNVSDGQRLTLSGAVNPAAGKIINKTGTGTLYVTSTNVWDGTLNVTAGTLIMNGSRGTAALARSFSVSSGATLGGTGVIWTRNLNSDSSTSLNVAAGGTVAPGDPLVNDGLGTLTVRGSLRLNGETTVLSFDLSDETTVGAGVNDLIEVLKPTTAAGALTLNGVLNINAVDNTLAAGTYRLINYAGVLTNNTLVMGTVPTGYTVNDFTIDTSVAGQVNLVVAAIPEPTSMGLIALAALGLRRRNAR